MPLLELEEFSRLVESVYAAGLDSDRWQNFCDQLNAALPGARIMMQGHDIRTRTNLGNLSSNYDPFALEQYESYFVGINAYLPKLKDIQVGRIVCDYEIISYDELIKTEYWDGFLRDGDYSAAVGSVLFRDSDRFLFLSGNFNWEKQDRYRAKSRLLWSLLTPHARRAFEIQRSIRGEKLLDQGYRQALDRVHNAVFLLDSRGRVSHHNKAAQAVLAGAQALRLERNGRLRALDPDADNRITHQIASIADRRYADLENTVTLRPKGDLRPLLAKIVPFKPHETATGMFADFVAHTFPVAMLTVVDTASNEARLRDSLSEKFNLTHSEIEVAVLLHSGRSLRSCSDTRGVSVNTIRNQVRSILEKTNTHRQSEFVALTNTLL